MTSLRKSTLNLQEHCAAGVASLLKQINCFFIISILWSIQGMHAIQFDAHSAQGFIKFNTHSKDHFRHIKIQLDSEA